MRAVESPETFRSSCPTPARARRIFWAYRWLIRRPANCSRASEGITDSTLPARGKFAFVPDFDTLLLLASEHPKVVQERMGHSQISITMDTYSHVLPGMGRGAATKLDAIITAKPKEAATAVG